MRQWRQILSWKPDYGVHVGERFVCAAWEVKAPATFALVLYVGPYQDCDNVQHRRDSGITEDSIIVQYKYLPGDATPYVRTLQSFKDIFPFTVPN
jgi:hypothetical protein